LVWRDEAFLSPLDRAALKQFSDMIRRMKKEGMCDGSHQLAA
jgi:hypothetical protein